MHIVTCSCGTEIDARDMPEGIAVKCPSCGKELLVPISNETTTIAMRGAVAKLADFDLKRKLGEGGMGEVYLARDVRLRRDVALKILPEDLARDPKYVMRFEREARAAARVSNPNVVQIYAVGEEDGKRFIAMEYVKGKSLDEVLEEEGRIGLARAAKYIAHAARGLGAAAANGVVHRDVKPANLLVDEEGRTKVADFGLARAEGSRMKLTAAGAVVGSPLYMSPEQGHGRQTDFRSDIYSLGATFYHLVAGHPPFTGQTAMTVMLKHLEDPLTPAEDVGEEANAVLARMMAKDPAGRYQDYASLIADLEGLAGLPRSTPPPAPARKPVMLAAHFSRAFAFAVDILVCWLAAKFIAARLQAPEQVAVASFLIYASYYTVFHAASGAGLGKWIAGIRAEALDGSRAGIARTAWRFLFSWAPIAAGLSLAPVLGEGPVTAAAAALIWTAVHAVVLVRADRRGLHDLVAGTRVVLASSVVAALAPAKDPLLAVLLAVFPGAGQVYCGRFLRGFLVLLTFFLIVPYLWSFFDAYRLAVRANEEAMRLGGGRA